MTRPWQTLDAVPTQEGELVLLARGDEGDPGRDYMIKVGSRVLMVSQGSRSERALATLAHGALEAAPGRGAGRPGAPPPRVLIGGLGLGFTLRAALELWPSAAEVVVSEINPVVVRWCRGPLAGLTGRSLEDPRVRVEERDVAEVIRRAADARPGPSARFDAILLDLYEGPNAGRRGGAGEAHYGDAALEATRRALRAGGVLAVWSEEPDAAFERRLERCGFTQQRLRPEGGGRRHVVYLALRRS